MSAEKWFVGSRGAIRIIDKQEYKVRILAIIWNKK
jgi:hypothetical protein